MTSEASRRLRRLPRIRRARGYRLYTTDGRRFLDLWQAGGQAVLGHRGANVVSAAKRVLERGVLPPLPSGQEHRLHQALRRLLPELAEYQVLLYQSAERALEAVGRLRDTARSNERARGTDPPAAREDRMVLPAEPVHVILRGAWPRRPDATEGSEGSEAGGIRAAYWRPFMDEQVGATSWRNWDVLLPVLPAGGMLTAQVVLVRPGLPAVDGASDLLPEPVLVMLTRAADALVSAPVPRVIRLDGFAGVGPYLVPERLAAASQPVNTEDEAFYNGMFDCFLKAGVVLSPDAATPSIVPGEISEGERDLLVRVARECRGGANGH